MRMQVATRLYITYIGHVSNDITFSSTTYILLLFNDLRDTEYLKCKYTNRKCNYKWKELSGIPPPPNIFNSWLVKSKNAEPADREGQLYVICAKSSAKKVVIVVKVVKSNWRF